jgi:hypothetical protein
MRDAAAMARDHAAARRLTGALSCAAPHGSVRPAS